MKPSETVAMLAVSPVLLVGLIAVIAGAVILGSHRWSSETRVLRAHMEAARVTPQPEMVRFGDIEGLPAPVQRFLRTTLSDGQPMVAGARIRHRGTFNISTTTERWRPFTSDQTVVTQRPGFVWDARIAMVPGLPVHVHDAYIAGEGILHASLLGLGSLADLRGGDDVAEGELLRFFAEAAWYPTALLPSQGVRWEPVDAHSARGTLRDGTLSVTLLFTFAETGLIETVRAEARGRAVSGRVVPTPWQGRFWNDSERDGMRVPLDGEVAWLLPAGEKPYWRGRISGIDYTFAR